MGEHEQAGRLPGEIVEVYRAPLRREARDPREIIEVYRQPDRREVVEVYRRPVPGRRAPVGKKPGPGGWDRRHGLYCFFLCVAIMIGLTVAAKAVEYLTAQSRPEAENVVYERTEITIPAWPVDQGAGLAVSREPGGEALTAQEVYRRLNPAVVTVQCLTGEGVSIGTGVIFSEDGYILTNHHVVRGGSECYVTLDSGYSLDVRFVAGDEDSDLAVLKVPPEELALMPLAALHDSSWRWGTRFTPSARPGGSGEP